VTFVDVITVLSQRFLTERSFELIVAPAIADGDYDGSASRPTIASHLASAVAFAGACWDDARRGGHLTTFAGLALIPLCYYSFWFLVWVPQGVRDLGAAFMAGVTLVVLLLSLAPVIVCYWPSAEPRRTSSEQP
jgi:hypothetical protein